MKPTLLSIDWDFFIYNPNELADTTIVVYPGTDKQLEVPIKQVCDWGGSEGWGTRLGYLLWTQRAADCLRLGLDLEKIMSIRTDKGCVTTDTFINTLDSKLHLHNATQLIGDSHAFGIACAQDVWTNTDPSQPIRIINFDAHHDLGYDNADLKKEIKCGLSDCASWLFHALYRDLTDEVVVVYPNWKGKREWRNLKRAHHLKPYLTKIRLYTWSEWVANESYKDSSVDMIYQARSSAWTPPWMDSEFQKLYSNMPGGDLTCIDCTEHFGQCVGHYDACTQRQWDADAVREINKRWEQVCRMKGTI